MAKKILRLPKVKSRTGRCRSSIYSDMGKGTFPQQIRLGGRSVGWLESDIDTWIEEKAQQRDLEDSSNQN